MAKLSITVNKTRCIGSGDCVETAPAVFQLDENEKSNVVNPTGAADSSIVAAARSCPVKAITVVDEDTGTAPLPAPDRERSNDAPAHEMDTTPTHPRTQKKQKGGKRHERRAAVLGGDRPREAAGAGRLGAEAGRIRGEGGAELGHAF